MSYSMLFFKGFNRENNYNKYFIDLNDNTYIFTVRWSFYCKCAFLAIEDFNGNEIISGLSLVNGLKIRHNKLPYILCFLHKDGKTFEPTLNNISKEFVLLYKNKDEE